MFFLSVEDDLMRRFAGDRLEALLNNKRIGLQEGEALEHPLISKMLERAQNKVESMHFEARKTLLKFDDVMNDQRKVIYEQRREIMESDSQEDLIRDMRHDTIEDMVREFIPPGTYAEQWSAGILKTEAQRLLNLDIPVDEWAKEEGIADQEILSRIMEASDNKMAEKAANYSPKLWRNVEKSVLIQILDQLWKEHLLNLDHLRQGINLRAFGQRDPLNEYKTEAFALFEILLNHLRESVTQTLSIIEIDVKEGMVDLVDPRQNEQEMHETRQDPALANSRTAAPVKPQQPGLVKRKNFAKPLPKTKRVQFNKDDPSTWGKVPRNAPCPCGSGKKFKFCHGNVAQVANGS